MAVSFSSHCSITLSKKRAPKWFVYVCIDHPPTVLFLFSFSYIKFNWGFAPGTPVHFPHLTSFTKTSSNSEAAALPALLFSAACCRSFCQYLPQGSDDGHEGSTKGEGPNHRAKISLALGVNKLNNTRNIIASQKWMSLWITLVERMFWRFCWTRPKPLDFRCRWVLRTRGPSQPSFPTIREPAQFPRNPLSNS